MRNTILSALTVGALLATPCVAPVEAQPSDSPDLKTVLVVSISGFDAFKNDVQAIAEASGLPQMMMPFMMLGPQGPPGLDTTKPWGSVVQTDGQQYRVLAFVPVTDLEKTLALAKQFAQDAEIPEPDSDGVYEIDAQGQTVFMVQKGGWAYLSNEKDSLAEAPDDPAPLLDGLNESYAVAVKAVVENVPQEWRDKGLAMIESGMEGGNQQLPGETPEQYAIRKRAVERSRDELAKLINETVAIQIGLGVEPDSKAVRLDIEMTAMEGSSASQKVT